MKNLFITEKEIDELEKLPIEESSTNLSPKGGGRQYPVAIVERQALERYRSLHIEER